MTAPTAPAPPAAGSTACPTCSMPVAVDQRYCLNCGRCVGDARQDLLRALAPQPVSTVRETEVAVQEPVGPRLWSPVGGGALAALLVAGLLIGLLLSGGEEEPMVVRVASPPAPDVRVNVTGGGGATDTSETVSAEFVSDWPGDDGWTVQLQTLPKEGSTPEDATAAKTSAESQGASDVGVLDSDEWSSLDAGNYVVYSGVFTTKKDATAALRKLRKDFPDAKVVKVSAGAGAVDKDADKQSDRELQDLQTAGGDDYVKKSKKLPDKVATEGEVPEKDDKKPGGGSDATVLE